MSPETFLDSCKSPSHSTNLTEGIVDRTPVLRAEGGPAHTLKPRVSPCEQCGEAVFPVEV
jgi:hypothetical protein